MQLSKGWLQFPDRFELDLADEEDNLETWQCDIPPQECKITGTLHSKQEIRDGILITHFQIKDCLLIKKATGEMVARLDETESGDE